MRRFVSFALPILIALSGAANAQVVVIGEPLATACYESAANQRYTRHALQQCDDALDGNLLGRDRAATLINRGIILMRTGYPTDALRDFEEAENWNVVSDAVLAVNRSGALILLGRFGDAIAQTDIAIAADEANLADAWFNRAVALEALNDLSGAYHAFQTALEIRPDWPLAQRELDRFSVDNPS